MKYWLFDGSDVVGPFTPQELAARPGFAPTSLVCPENNSDQEDSWKMASAFEELSAEPAPAAMPKKPTSRSGAKAKLDIVVDDDD